MAPVLWASTTYDMGSLEEGRQMAHSTRAKKFYSRHGNPTVNAFESAVAELENVLSPDLRDELETMVLPFSSDTPTESELRIAQAQLVGWLEGLFHGIQATLFTQQAMAQQQIEEIGRAHV